MKRIRHVVFEGLPAVGKSEMLELLARFHPESVRVLPELVKDLVTRCDLDLYRDREALASAIADALPARAESIRRIIDDGFLCLEESHLGVHYAYAKTLGDDAFVGAYASLETSLPEPDLYVRLDLPVGVSRTRQIARATPGFEVTDDHLARTLKHLNRWHQQRKTHLLTIDADRPAHAVLADVERHLRLDYGVRPEALDETFDVLLLLGRPAGGKSEFIDFFTSCPPTVRATDYHVAPFDVVDDFPILWEIFRDDDLWERLGHRRLYSRRCNGNYAVTDEGVWPFLIGRINRAVCDLGVLARLDRRTLIVEFSRGGSTGYADALAGLSPEILRRAAILYVSVSFEESWRRNIARYDETDRGGILTHSVPRQEMEKTYGTDDWFDIAPNAIGDIEVNGIPIPYATMPNEPESKNLDVLGLRYRSALAPLYELWRKRR